MILNEIPLIAGQADQTLDVTLDGQPYTLRVLWNTRFEYFSLSINEKDGDAILTNIKMVNNYPLLKRFKRLPMAGELYFIHRGGKTYRPTFDDIGMNTYGLYYYDPEEAPDNPVPLLPLGAAVSIWDNGNSIWDGGASNWDV